MMRMVPVLLLLASAAGTTPALANDGVGYRAIAAGDLAGAEKALVAERRIYPARPELMLNLAAVYARTGRTEQARALYREVMTQPVVALDVASGASVSSHALAGAGLARLAPAQVAVR